MNSARPSVEERKKSRTVAGPRGRPMDLENWLALLCAVGLVLNGIQAVEMWQLRRPWWMILPWGINLVVLGMGLAWWGYR